MRTVITVVVVVFAVMASGCGGGDDDSANGSAAQTAIDADAQARAESVVLQLEDFPDGWRASTPDEEDADSEEKFRTCIGVDYSGLTRTGEAKSREFSQGSADASSEVAVYEDASQAEDAVEQFEAGMSGTKVEDCVSELLNEAAEDENQEFEIGEVDVGELGLTPPEVEQTSAWQLAITIEFTSGEAEGLSPVVYIDLVHLRDGDTIATVETSDVLTAFDSALRDELLQTTAARMSE